MNERGDAGMTWPGRQLGRGGQALRLGHCGHCLQTVEEEALIKNNNTCKDFLIEAMKYHLLPLDQRLLIKNPRTKPRTPVSLPKVSPSPATARSGLCPWKAAFRPCLQVSPHAQLPCVLLAFTTWSVESAGSP